MPSIVGRRILVVDSEPLAALQSESMLKQLGCSVPGRPGKAADALAILETDRLGFDAALIKLTDERSAEIIAALDARGIPFVITINATSTIAQDQSSDRPTLVAPFRAEELERALSMLTMRFLHSTR